MRFTHTSQATRRAVAATLLLVMAMGCGDAQGPGWDPVDTPGTPLPFLIVSNPGASGIVYVSLPSGSFASGERIVIQTRRTGVNATTVLTAGGFEPVPIAARGGDTLALHIYLNGTGAVRDFFSVVPAHRPPVLVLSDPASGRRDVSSNTVLRLVFSEPINPATLTASSVRLYQGGVPVAGTLAFVDAENLTATFTPALPLAPGIDYALGLTRVIEDQDGEPLEAPVAIPFAVKRELSPVVTIYQQVAPMVPGYDCRFVLDDKGSFEQQWETVTMGNFAYPGRYGLTDSLITFYFDANPAPWVETGTLRGDSLVVRLFDPEEVGSFVDLVYVRSSGVGP
jgi:hypothetical protein